MILRITLTVCLIISSALAIGQCTDLNLNISESQNSFCGPGTNTVTFTNNSTGAEAATTTFNWSVNGSLEHTSVGTGTWTYDFNGVGNYTLTVEAETTGGCTDNTPPISIEVVPVPSANFSVAAPLLCSNQAFSFTNNSTGTFTGTTYNWDFGDGSNSSDENPSYTYTNAGNYTVTLTVTNSAGCQDTYIQPVTIEQSPVVAIAGADDDGDLESCVTASNPLTDMDVVFTNYTTNAISHLWDFGDGATGNTPSPTHNYNTYGVYNIQYTAESAAGCVSTDSLQFIFQRRTTADFTFDVNQEEGCAPHTINTLVNNSDAATSYLWDFGDGTTSTATTPTNVYTNEGNYTISLRAINSCGYSEASYGPIIVEDVPNTAFSLNPSSNFCAPVSNIMITNSTTEASAGPWGSKYEWDFDNGTTLNTNAEITPPQNYTNQGNYTISLTATNGCGANTVTRDIRVDSIPELSVIANPIEACSPQVIEFTNNSTDNHPSTNHYWHWSPRFPGDIERNYYPYYYVRRSYNKQRPDLTFNYPTGPNPVNGDVYYRISNACGTKDTTINIITHRPTHANFSIPSSVCVGDAININDNSNGENIAYKWDFGDGNLSTTLSNDTTYTYNTVGDVDLELIVDGYCGPDTIVRTLTVKPFPIADVSVAEDSLCFGDEIILENNIPDTVSAHYWNFGEGITYTSGGTVYSSSSAYTPGNITYGTDGQKRITYQSTLNGCTSHDTVYARLHPNPEALFNLSSVEECSPFEIDGTVLTNSSINNTNHSYNWDYGNGSTSNGFNANTTIYEALGNTDSLHTIKLEIITDKGCVDSLKRDITIHPLPVSDFSLIEDTICRNVPTDIINNSTIGSNYEWNFDGTGSSIDFEPNYIFPSDGNFEIELISFTNFGCSDTITDSIFIDQIPNANFDASEVCEGFNTVFTDASTGNINRWEWIYGDGNNNTTDTNPIHQFGNDGAYNTSLVIENLAGCTDTLTKTVNVLLVPEPQINATEFCLTNNTQFQGTNNAPASTINNWYWDFGDGNNDNSNVNNPTHEYSTVGVYDAKLIVENDLGCIDSIEQTITITETPVSDFDFTAMCMNDTIMFNDLSSGAPDSYNWSFDNGDTSTDEEPRYAYNVDGTYNVSLTTAYTASGCNHTITKPVEVYPRTVPNFTNTTVCLNEPTVFTDATTNNPNDWKWIFDEGAANANTQNTTHTYGSAGNYDVSLITENSFGCVDTITRVVTINTLPIADFSFDTVCLGNSTTINDLSIDAINWEYTWGDGNSAAGTPSPSYTYTTANTYTVEQIVTTINGCKDTTDRTITVRPNPTADYSFTEVCNTYATQFTDMSSASAVGWSWDFGDPASTTGQTQDTAFVYPDEGTYTSTLTVSNTYGCTDQISKTVLVKHQPTADFTNPTVCAGSSVNFNNTSQGNNHISYAWDFGDGTTSTNQDEVHDYAIGGTYPITLIVENNVGCIDTLIRNIDVFNVPFPDFVADTVCIGSMTSFTNLTTDASGLGNDYFWDFGDGNSSYQATPTYIYDTPGVYTVTLLAGNPNGCDSTIQKDVRVAEVPVADFINDTVCMGNPTEFTDVSTGIPNEWIWNFGDGTIINATDNVTHEFNTEGDYLVTLRVTGGGLNCTDEVYKIVTVNEVPKAMGTLDDQACLDQEVNFQNNSVMIKDSIVSYSWNMGDNTTYYTENGEHQYTAEGVYDVLLRVTSSQGCQDSIVFSTEIHPLPQTGLNTYPLEFCPGETLTLEAYDGLSYDWTGPNEFTNSQQMFTLEKLTKENEGFYNLRVTDGNNCENIDSVNVSVLTGKNCLVVTQLVTPNSDGNNDTWIIEGVEQYPNVEVNIFNRWGSLLYNNKQYANEWSGEVNKGLKIVPEGQVPEGTYYYTIDLNDGVTEIINGFIEVEY
ncbi:hypothetical protein CW751_10895 [Brumimicrobium salinarum]|uniref:PKD domain-containing protein n=1 Tax=Brumimicrobium salinarum TaxID=2058658 RepID=A0A2I0R0U7_9FLAO|nr:PKD domain-containing protein [Brumimicrobium salinarum]PKR80165.1 hypothetical protein CW751_10895 [Brumimicrobium salinarum]